MIWCSLRVRIVYHSCYLLFCFSILHIDTLQKSVQHWSESPAKRKKYRIEKCLIIQVSLWIGTKYRTFKKETSAQPLTFRPTVFPPWHQILSSFSEAQVPVGHPVDHLSIPHHALPYLGRQHVHHAAAAPPWPLTARSRSPTRAEMGVRWGYARAENAYSKMWIKT